MKKEIQKIIEDNQEMYEKHIDEVIKINHKFQDLEQDINHKMLFLPEYIQRPEEYFIEQFPKFSIQAASHLLKIRKNLKNPFVICHSLCLYIHCLTLEDFFIEKNISYILSGLHLTEKNSVTKTL